MAPLALGLGEHLAEAVLQLPEEAPRRLGGRIVYLVGLFAIQLVAIRADRDQEHFHAQTYDSIPCSVLAAADKTVGRRRFARCRWAEARRRQRYGILAALKLRDIAERLECRLDGDGDLEIARVTTLDRAAAGDLTFFTNPKYAAALKQTAASAVILGEQADAAPCAMLRSRNPYLAFAKALELFAESWRPAPGVHRLAYVGEGAAIAPDASVGPFSVVGEGAIIGARTLVHPHVTIGREVRIGEDCVIHAQVSIRERVVIGQRVVVQDGAVIGSDGYGFARTGDGGHYKIPQVGGVVIDDDVEIGAGSAIDRPAVGETRIGAGTKIDNLVQVAHGVTVGRNVLLAGQVGIAGSTTIEDNVTLAGQVGVAGHITIGKGTVATAQTGIPNSVDPGSFISGYPAIDNRDWLKASAVFRKLPELRKAIAALEKRVAELESRKS
jgi:UDP-3-O-[3-hydroxymyristoyl] glucosamine N-acyltransferase